MKLNTIAQFLLAAGLAVALECGAAFAQTATQDLKNAGHDTGNAASNTAHAAKTATKKAYNKTRSGARKAYRKTANGTKTAAHRTQNAGDALAGKPPQHPSSTPPGN